MEARAVGSPSQAVAMTQCSWMDGVIPAGGGMGWSCGRELTSFTDVPSGEGGQSQGLSASAASAGPALGAPWLCRH